MTNTDFYKTHSFNNLEIAICLEDVDSGKKGKFFIPALTPFLNKDNAYDKVDPKYSNANILSGNKNMDLKQCTLSNYINLNLPESVITAKKDDKFVVAFIGGDINKPYLIGRYN